MARCRRAVALRLALAGGDGIYSSFPRPYGERHRETDRHVVIGCGHRCHPPTRGKSSTAPGASTPFLGHVIEVAELIVFRSYLDPTKDRLGDLDLAVKFRDLLPDATPDERMEKRLAYSRASGRQFRL